MENKTLALKLFAIQCKNISVTKDWVNPHFRSKYMTLDNIIETLSPFLAENKLLVTHFIDWGTITTRVVDVESGELLESHFPMNATDPQKCGSEVTYGKRYNLVALFNICADEDDDGNAVSWNNAPQKHETVSQVPDKPWIKKENIDALFTQMHEWAITAWSGQALVAKAREYYAVSKAMADEIQQRYQKEFI